MVPTVTLSTMSSPSRPLLLLPSPWRPRSALYSGLKRKCTSVLWRSLDSMYTSPPRPPSPPEGPPRGTNFSRRKATHPLPPSPAFTRIRASSMNIRNFVELAETLEFVAKAIGHGLLWVQSDDARFDAAVARYHDVRRKRVHAKQVSDMAIGITILDPIHLFGTHKVFPLLFIFVGTDANEHQPLAFIFLAQVFQFRQRFAARRTPCGPEIQHHNLAQELLGSDTFTSIGSELPFGG